MEDVSDCEEKIDTYGNRKRGRPTEQEYEREHSESFKSAQKFRIVKLILYVNTIF